MTVGGSGQEGETIRRRITHPVASMAVKQWTRQKIGSRRHGYAGVVLRL